MAYTLTLSREEYDALQWCAARYESARILADGMVPEEEELSERGRRHDALTFTVPEHVAWESRDAIADDGGDPWERGGFIPCLRCAAIQCLFDSIV
jgi:hypothetical protein